MKDKMLLIAPVSGTCVDISEVPDETFSGKVLGDGVAFRFDGDTICSPCDGEIILAAETKHAVAIRNEAGLEVMLHVGIDTVNLEGNGFTMLAAAGEKVKTGAPLIRIDRDYMEEQGVNLIMPMILLNHREFDYEIQAAGKAVEQGKTAVVSLQMDGEARRNQAKRGQELPKEKARNQKGEVTGVKQGSKYQVLCGKIIEMVGGKQNVLNVTHCVTRLRFRLKDESLAKTEQLKKTQGVMKIIQAGGQYQVVIGPHVDEVYKELMEIGGFSSKEAAVPAAQSGEKQNLLSGFLVLMSGIFQPILSILMASGMIKALLVLFRLAGILDQAGGTYMILNAMGDALFYFFPVAVGWSSARKFGIKDIYGITLGACLSYPALTALTLGEPLYTVFTGTIFESGVYTEFLGLPVIFPGAGYAGSVIPIILIVFVASLIFKYLTKHLPAMVRSFFVPFLTLLITMPIALVVVGPIAMLAQGLLGELIQLIIGFNTGLAGLVLGTFWSVLVMFGLHMPIIMMFNVNISTYGYDIINPLIFSGALASMGAVLGVIIRTKSVEVKNMAVPAFFSTFFGVNEPTLYGILIPRKKLMCSCFLSAGIGSMITGFCGAKLYAFGASGPLGLPCFINPQGIDMGFIGLCIGALVSFVLALACSLVLGDKKDGDALDISIEE